MDSTVALYNLGVLAVDLSVEASAQRAAAAKAWAPCAPHSYREQQDKVVVSGLCNSLMQVLAQVNAFLVQGCSRSVGFTRATSSTTS